MKHHEKRMGSMRIANMHIPSHILLCLWSVVALFPLWVLFVNTFKVKMDIYKNPFGLPAQWTMDNYNTVLKDGQYFTYFLNSFLVVVISLGMILVVGSLAAYAFSHWKSKLSTGIHFLIILGMMVPIKIATIRLLEMMKFLGLLNTLWSLFPIYIAMGIPTAVFILTSFIRELPNELYEAGYMDGAGRFKIFNRIVIPLIRPALATVAIYNLVPIWNDLWFPLIFINKENQKTVLLAVTRLQGQYTTDWPKVLAVLALSALPVMALYLTMSKQFIRGLTAGAVKG